MRGGKRLIFDFVFVSIHVTKWILGLYLGISFYQAFPVGFWVLIFLFLGAYIIQDLYRVLKAVIKDTTLDSLNSEGKFSYVRGIDPKELTAAKIQVLLYLAVFTIGIIGVTNNVNQWKEDGQNRLGNIVISSFLAAAPLIVVVGQFKKRD